MNKIKSLLTSKEMWIGLGVGLVLAIGFSRFVPSIVTTTVKKLPGAA